MPTVRGVSENVVAGLIGAGVLILGGWLLSLTDASVALWAVFVVGALSAGLGFFIGWLVHDRSDLPAYQADLLGEAMLALRDHAAGRLDVSFEDLIERGILAPARFGLSVVPGEEIRLSILALDDSGQAFRMIYESGHSLGRKENFSLPRTSLAGHAFDAKELKWTDSVIDDERWQRHPLADKKRRYKSLASMPIVVGGESVAVLNVVSTEAAAFFKGDLTYIELLGALIALAWDIHLAAEASSNFGAVDPADVEGGK
jgi:GAF domain-containing protein